jgi:hypothetical protein
MLKAFLALLLLMHTHADEVTCAVAVSLLLTENGPAAAEA